MLSRKARLKAELRNGRDLLNYFTSSAAQGSMPNVFQIILSLL
jgi:hypothetical protein